METIRYRNTKILIQTLPKGTLLFRLVKDSINDTRGVPLDDGTRCIIPNFNVFFYPNPLAAKYAFGKYIEIDDMGNTVYVYILTKDIKIIRLLMPSKYTRAYKRTKRSFIKECSSVSKGCMPLPLPYYDPCLSDTIINKYPDVVGIMGIPKRDTIAIRKTLKNKSKKVKSIFKMAEDARGIPGLPELILHPLSKRPSKQMIVKNSDILENNYEVLTKFNIHNEPRIMQFMDKHTKYDPETFFYKYVK